MEEDWPVNQQRELLEGELLSCRPSVHDPRPSPPFSPIHSFRPSPLLLLLHPIVADITKIKYSTNWRGKQHSSPNHRLPESKSRIESPQGISWN